MAKKKNTNASLLTLEKYKIVRKIGKGSFGLVFQATRKWKKSDFAIKKVTCSAPENVELALQEFWTLSRLPQHINIIRFEECFLQHSKTIRPLDHGDTTSEPYLNLIEMAIKGKRSVRQTPAFLWFVMEYCDSGDLNEFLLEREENKDLNAMCMLQLAEGIAFLHKDKNNVVHRDLKPENILVHSFSPDNAGPLLKIADFGLSKVCTRFVNDSSENQTDFNIDTCYLSSACGSDFFMAPEVFDGHYTAKADVFAMGVIFWAIMDQITFIDAETNKLLLGTYVKKGNAVLPVGEVLLENPKLELATLLQESGTVLEDNRRGRKTAKVRSCVAANVKHLRNLIVEMLTPNPETRPNSQELLTKLRKVLKPNKRPLHLEKKSLVKTEEFLQNDLPQEVSPASPDKPKVRQLKNAVRKTLAKSVASPEIVEEKTISENEESCTTVKNRPATRVTSKLQSKKFSDEENKATTNPTKPRRKLRNKTKNKKVLNEIKNCESNIEVVTTNRSKQTTLSNTSHKSKKLQDSSPAIVSETTVKNPMHASSDDEVKPAGNTADAFPFTMPFSPRGRRRHNGLKAQICEHKNPVSRLPVPKFVPPQTNISSDKVEVPRTPCVVTVSKVKHHPILPMKKRWRKYLLLAEIQIPPDSNTTLSAQETHDKLSKTTSNVVNVHRSKQPLTSSGSSGTTVHPSSNYPTCSTKAQYSTPKGQLRDSSHESCKAHSVKVKSKPLKRKLSEPPPLIPINPRGYQNNISPPNPKHFKPVGETPRYYQKHSSYSLGRSHYQNPQDNVYLYGSPSEIYINQRLRLRSDGPYSPTCPNPSDRFGMSPSHNVYQHSRVNDVYGSNLPVGFNVTNGMPISPNRNYDPRTLMQYMPLSRPVPMGGARQQLMFNQYVSPNNDASPMTMSVSPHHPLYLNPRPLRTPT